MTQLLLIGGAGSVSILVVIDLVLLMFALIKYLKEPSGRKGSKGSAGGPDSPRRRRSTGRHYGGSPTADITGTSVVRPVPRGD